MGEDPGLSRAGPGEDEQRSLAVADGLALGVVQLGEQPLGAIGTRLRSGAAFGERGAVGGGFGLGLEGH